MKQREHCDLAPVLQPQRDKHQLNRDGAQEEEVIDKAGRADPVEVIKMILDAGADINAVNVNQANTALHLAALKGNDKVVQYLISRGARVDIKNKLDKTAGEVGPKHTTDLIAKLTKKD